MGLQKYFCVIAASVVILFAACSAENSKQPGLARETAEDVTRAIDGAADWQLDNMDNFDEYVTFLVSRTEEPRGWVQGVFYLGLAKWADATDNGDFYNFLRQHGEEQNWQLGDRLFHADDHVIAQYYLMVSDRDDNPTIVKPTQEAFDQILSESPTPSLDFEGEDPKLKGLGYERSCQLRWCWSDALFMSPPVWFHLTKITGDPKYADYAHSEYQAVTEYLFDDEYSLYFRDSRFFERREDDGKKIFWSRGNGWVYAGLADIIDALDKDDPRRAWYVDLFQKMSKSLISLQRENGYWPVSLAAGDSYTVPESSGTAFFTAGLAWGVNRGILEADDVLPTIQKGWQALINAQKDDGMLGWVQQIGYAPDKVSKEDTQLYGAGAFLIAGVHMLALVQNHDIYIAR